MTDREHQMIEEYLPNPPDPDLAHDEFYYLQSTMKGEQVIRVFALDILPHKDGTEYGIYQMRGSHLRRVDVGYGDPSRGCHRGELYDNRQDCKDRTHWWEDRWEELRELQRKEGLI